MLEMFVSMNGRSSSYWKFPISAVVACSFFFCPDRIRSVSGFRPTTLLTSSTNKIPRYGNRSLTLFSKKNISRRKLLQVSSSVLPATVPFLNSKEAASMDTETQKPSSINFGAKWSATDGLNSLNEKSEFVSFDTRAYKAMKEDKTRTPIFERAISDRLGDDPEDKVVLDLGTGPYALFALIAAQQGAGKVYAIEANPEAAESARVFVKRSGYADVITILEGFSTEIELPEKADFCIAEIVGSVASEEGVYATIGDAHRHLKDPSNDRSWIPSRIQTYAAPASYSLHNLFGPPDFDWSKLNGEPVRFSCRDKGLELLSTPKLIEDITFANIPSISNNKKSGGIHEKVLFIVNENRIKENEIALFQEFRRDNKSSVEEAGKFAEQTAHSFSGIAMWPRLILSDSIIIDSRHFGDGNHQQSHWQTVLPIMSGRPLANLIGGERIEASFNFMWPSEIAQPPHYMIEGTLNYI